MDKEMGMAVVGDRVQIPSKRVGQTPREGVVTGVSGALLRVAWSGGEESTIMPSMGSLVVVGRARGGAGPRPRRTPAKRSTTGTGSAPSTRARATKAVKSPTRKADKPSPKKAAKAPAKKAGKAPAKKAKAPAKKTKSAKKVKRAKELAPSAREACQVTGRAQWVADGEPPADQVSGPWA